MNASLRFFFAITAISLFNFANAYGQANSWTKPTSGNWEELHWSLGVRPAFDHAIQFTNEGWKALAIGPTTVRDYPSTMQIFYLTVLSPTNSFNTLMLNHAGVQTPLRVSQNFYLGSNSVFLSLSSGLQVGNVFTIDGTVNHGDFSQVRAPILIVGSSSPGAYNLSNGVLSVSNYMFVGHTAPGTFTQHGGSNIAAQLRFRAAGEYALSGGDLAVGRMIVGDESSGILEQSGGRVAATNSIAVGGDLGAVDGASGFGSGRYILAAGALQTPLLSVGFPRSRLEPGGDGVFDQSGGSVSANALTVGAHQADGIYNLVAGDLVTSNSTVTSGGTFFQSGGNHLVDESVTVAGQEGESAFERLYADYRLSNGLLRAQTLIIDFARFVQSGGTNDIAGDLVIEREAIAESSYHLSGGRLNTYNTIVNPSFHGGFTQTGGLHSIIGRLDLLGPAAPFTIGPSVPVLYALSSGQLSVDDIRVATNAIFRHTGGTINQSGILTLAGGNWESAPGDHQLGILALGSAPTNSSLTLPDPATTLRFTSSGLMAWAPDALLMIHNWRGSTNGGGMHRIIFGAGPSGLNASQLAKVRFRNPAGLPAGDYGARILSTGEIVPASRPPVSYARNGNQLTLQWPAGWTLQTATNISGPFVDVNSSGSYTTSTSADPQRYFRLRQ